MDALGWCRLCGQTEASIAVEGELKKTILDVLQVGFDFHLRLCLI